MVHAKEIDEVALKNRASAGQSSTEIGRVLDCGRQVVMRRAKRLGVEVTGNGKRSFRSIESEVAEMKPTDAVEYLLECLRNVLSSVGRDNISEVIQYGFTPTESQVVLAIFSDKVQSKEMIYNLIYGLRSNGELVDPKIIDVLVCGIRKKLLTKGWGVKIETIWGRGYRGERLDGFLFPWEQV